jgi:TRAP transporter TAXI family solute receptor
MKKTFIVMTALVLILAASTVRAAKTERLSVATGGTGGVYYPMGGGMAAVISKYIPSAEATAEVTAASVDNCILIGRKKADLAFSMADTAWDAYNGVGKPFPQKLPLRTVLALYPNNLHVVTLEGKGIEKISDLKGKRVSTGAPGSGTEVMGLRLLEAAGLNPDKDVRRDKLSVSESAGALKDGKIDAFLWVGGIPTASVLDLAATPGVRIKLVPHGDLVAKMREKYGPIYTTGLIPAKTYPGQAKNVSIAVVWNILVCHESLPDNLVYSVAKVLLERRNELVAVHKDASYITLQNQASGESPIPFHPGALRYFKEKGLKIR